jgi:GxxExxY protein
MNDYHEISLHDQVLECAESVFNVLGPGHSEAVYHRSMEVALRCAGIQYETERVLPITYRGHVVGNFRCDLIIDDLIVELKVVTRLGQREELQAENYLKFSGKPVALLLNFGSVLESKTVTLPVAGYRAAPPEPRGLDEGDTRHHPYDPSEEV